MFRQQVKFILVSHSLLLLCSLFIISNLQGQNTAVKSSQQIGLPYIQNFTSVEYNAHPQNYAITQDPQGLIYFANGNGVLQFDGVNWRTLPLPQGGIAYSVGCSKNGTIYAGGEGDLGYLAPDKDGVLQFQSLLEQLPEEFRDFTYAWQISITEALVYFMTDKYLLAWPVDGIESTFKAWTLKNIYHTSHVIEDELYLWEWARGLEKIVGDSLQVLPGGDAFANSTIRILASLDDPTGKLFVGTVQKGFATYDGAKVERIQLSQKLTSLIEEGSLSNSVRLLNGTFAFATLGGGIILTDSAYQILQVLDETTGLGDNQVTNLFVDRSGMLWATMYDGLSRIEFPSSFSSYSEKLGLSGHVQGTFRDREQLYVYGYSGIFQLSAPKLEDTRTNFQFRGDLMPDRSGITTVMEMDDHVIVGSSGGIGTINPAAGQAKDQNNFAYKGTSKLLRSRFRQDLFYAAMGNTIGLFQKDKEIWKFIGHISGLPELTYSLVETAPGQLWGTSSNFVFLIIMEETIAPQDQVIKANPDSVIAAQVNTFDKSNGMPEGYVSVHLVNDEAIFATPAGLRRFNSSKRRFEPELSLPYTDTTEAIVLMQVQDNGNVWFVSKGEDRASLIQLKAQGNNQYSIQSTNFQHIYSQGLSITSIEEDPSDPNIAWISTSSGLVKYNAGVKADYAQTYEVLIRKILVNNDSVLYGGASANQEIPKLAFAFNSMRFEYAAPYYDLPEKTNYQVRLEGFDENWSPWTTEARKDYTQLPEGRYTFRVRAKNVFGTLGEEGSFSFSILPPWYRSWWAYLLYSIASISALLGFTYTYNAWRTRRLVEQNLELERLVAEQTEELRLSNEKLKELDQLKSQFFTNISHEFRTPLTIITGMANQIKQSPSKWLEKGTTMILRNSASLLQLINQILDLRKLERGGMQVNNTQGDIVHYLRYLLEAFHSLAENKDIKIHFLNSTESLMMDFDKDKMMHIFTNLMSNALKFTPEKGNVYVRTEMDVAHEDELPLLHIKVQDTGIGIAEDKLDKVFNRFFQVEGSQKKTAGKKSKGSGIGLSLVQELVQVLDGKIEVSSEVGRGTTFHITLPITNEAPIEEIEQIAEVVEAAPLSQAKVELPAVSPNESQELQHIEKPQLLIVEDNPDVVHYLHSLLEERYHLQIATDGEEGIDMALSSIPDLIISDVMMPYKNGYELCDTLKRDKTTSHIPIVLLTSRSDEESRLTGLEKGADAYLTKPFNPEELFLRLKKLHDLRLKLLARYNSVSSSLQLGGEFGAGIGSTQLEDQFISKLNGIIEEHIDDEQFGIIELCKAMAMSRTQLYRKLKSLTNRSISNYVRSIRLHKAKELLAKGDLNVTQVALEVGFNDRTYFSRAFIKEFGTSPKSIHKQ
ncbi:MAG: response regulator [Saprospiraceae bacterium]|nr:response regulator [Saprospiraceae bacterium]